MEKTDTRTKNLYSTDKCSRRNALKIFLEKSKGSRKSSWIEKGGERWVPEETCSKEAPL
jgi:hypothetical protein